MLKNLIFKRNFKIEDIAFSNLLIKIIYVD